MFNGSHCYEKSRIQHIRVFVQSSVALSVSVFTWTELLCDNENTVYLRLCSDSSSSKLQFNLKKKEKKKTLLTDHICQSRDSTGGNGNSLDGCCDNNKKSFSNDFKSRGDAHTFFRCKRLTSKEKSAKPAIPLRRKPQNTHTQKGMLKANDANLPWSHDQQ